MGRALAARRHQLHGAQRSLSLALALHRSHRMGRIGSMPSVPDDLVHDVASTSWSLAKTGRDHSIAIDGATPGQFSAECPACTAKLLVNVTGGLSMAAPTGSEHQRWQMPVSRVLRYATQIAPETSLRVAAELLSWPARRVLVVVDTEARPLGVLSSVHLVEAMAGPLRADLDRARAIDVATSGGPLMPEKTTLASAARWLVRDDRDYALVVEAGGKLSGLLLAADLLSVI